MQRFGMCFCWLMSWTCLFLLAGCSESNRAEVTGRVTLDGNPVENGTISFIPIGTQTGDGSNTAASGEISAGSYSIPANPGVAMGKNRVEIRWPRKTGRKIAGVPPAPAQVEELVEVIPACYNTKSRLREDIKSGQNELDFELNSRGAMVGRAGVR